jgi:prepilin-type processing-associated H-X9-DG protein
LLPQVEHGNLQRKWDYGDYRNNIGGSNATVAQVLQVLLCPSDPLPAPVYNVQVSPPYDWVNGFWGLSSYGGNGGKRSFGFDLPPSRDGIFFTRSGIRLADVIDGFSTTFLLGERNHHDPEFDRATKAFDPNNGPLASWGAWGSATYPGSSLGDVLLSAAVRINFRVPPGSSDADWQWEDDRLCAFGSGHAGGANFAFADGSARFVSDSIAFSTLQALATRAGGEVVNLP